MTEHKKDVGMAEMEEWFFLSIQEVSTSFGVSSETIIEIINEGIIPVQQDEQGEWLFDDQALRTVRTVLHLHQDLGVNMAGAGLALELLREIDRLRALLLENK